MFAWLCSPEAPFRAISLDLFLPHHLHAISANQSEFLGKEPKIRSVFTRLEVIEFTVACILFCTTKCTTDVTDSHIPILAPAMSRDPSDSVCEPDRIRLNLIDIIQGPEESEDEI